MCRGARRRDADDDDDDDPELDTAMGHGPGAAWRALFDAHAPLRDASLGATRGDAPSGRLALKVGVGR